MIKRTHIFNKRKPASAAGSNKRVLGASMGSTLSVQVKDIKNENTNAK